MMIRISPVVLVVAAGLAAAGSSFSATKPPTLIGSVGKGGAFVITLKDANGKVVKSVKPGGYKLVLSDYSKIHNFHFKGPGFEFRTKVPFVGQQSWSPVILRRGTYNFWCDPHKSKMKGSLRVAS